MYCTDCGQSVVEDIFGRLIHEFQVSDGHYPYVEELNGYR